MKLLAWSCLLWLPLLLQQLLDPYPWNHIITSPVLIHSVGLAAIVWLLTAGAATIGALLRRALTSEGRPGMNDSLPGDLLSATAASLAMLWLVIPLHGLIHAVPLDSTFGLLLTWGLGAVVGALVAAIPGRLPWRPSRLAAAMGCSFAAVCWVASVAQRFRLLESTEGRVVLGGVLGALLLMSGSTVRQGARQLRIALAAGLLGTALPFAAVLASGTPNAAPRESGSSVSSRINVLMLLVDTLRADHTGIGGGRPETMPEIRELLRERSTRFQSASAVGAATQPSVKALFTSQAPSHWGWEDANAPPPEQTWTLARAFRETGYRTGAISANGILDRPGFQTGFEDVLTVGAIHFFLKAPLLHELLSGGRDWEAFRQADRLGVHKEKGPVVGELALQWLEKNRDSAFFLYVHLMDPHWPYYDRGYGLLPESLRSFPDPLSHVELMSTRKGSVENARYQHSPATQEMRGRYDEEIRLADEALGTLLRGLRDLELDDSTLIVVLADHGEEFFEHLGFGHGHDVFEEQVHVPLLIRWPSAPRFADLPRDVELPVSLVDLLPTLTDYLELKPPPDPILGISLRPILEGKQTRTHPVVSSASIGNERVASYREGSFKVRFHYSRFAPVSKTRRVAVFDLDIDPGEQKPLALSHPQVATFVERARKHLTRVLAPGSRRTDRKPRVPVEDEALEQLRSLGYVE